MIMNDSLKTFIEFERNYFNSLNININWEDPKWNVGKWLLHRGAEKIITFQSINRINKVLPNNITLPKENNLPTPFINFVKAIVVYLKRTKNCGYMAIKNYVIECRRLHIIMNLRNEVSPTQLTRWHFEETLSLIKQLNYKNIYNSAINLKVISNIIDIKNLTVRPINYSPSIKPTHYSSKASSNKSIDLDKRINADKLPSYEALVAYAKCTNNPINDYEEILIRTIDLLIITGQRGNEITHIPLDCLVEKIIYDNNGVEICDNHGVPLMNVGIRYYAEKKFQSRVHWLAKQDIKFAKRAINRLKELTNNCRTIAKFQEDNANRIWNKNPDSEIADYDLLKYIGYENTFYLQNYLKKNGVKYLYKDKSIRFPRSKTRFVFAEIYRVGDVEDLLLKSIKSHDVLIEESNNKVILKTSQLLCLRPMGAFRFKRKANIITIYPGRVLLKEINEALGSSDKIESIFERRNLTEVDGSKIRLTSHQPRHWRNTLYELAGMSNVQQALALGRQNLTQNKYYQHTTIREKTKLHQEFLGFNSMDGKINFLRDGVRNKSILGDITETYHYLLENENLKSAEDFLNTHGLAIHLTPFGGCTHDFSQTPCEKYLQCWNGCSHLHRTNTPGETERIQEQLDSCKSILKNMLENSGEEYGKNVWVKDLKLKIKNLEKGIKTKPTSLPIKLFPKGKEVTLPKNKKRNSSV